MPSVDLLEEVAGVGNFSAQVNKRCDELNRFIANGDGGGLRAISYVHQLGFDQLIYNPSLVTSMLKMQSASFS